MNELIDIKGGAGEFEAAVIAVVLDRIGAETAAAGRPASDRVLPPWILALDPERTPLGEVHPR